MTGKSGPPLPALAEENQVSMRTLDRALWRYAIGVRTGRLPRQQGCELRKATRLRIDAEPPTSVQLDGDFYCETPIEIEVEKTPRLVLAAG